MHAGVLTAKSQQTKHTSILSFSELGNKYIRLIVSLGCIHVGDYLFNPIYDKISVPELFVVRHHFGQ